MSTSEEVVLEGDPFEGHRLIPLDEIGGILLRAHQSIDSDERYDFAEETWQIIRREVHIGSDTIHQFCETDLPLVLLEIMQDPKIYVWTMGPASPHYHPRLEVGSGSYIDRTKALTTYSP